MLKDKLMINDLKTEFIAIVLPQQEEKFTIPGIRVGDSLIPPCNQVRNLSVVFDKHQNIWAQVDSMCLSAYAHLCNIGPGPQCALPGGDPRDSYMRFITSRVDCCNALLYGVTQSSHRQAAADPEQCRQNPDTHAQVCAL